MGWDGGAAELITLTKEGGDLFAHALKITNGVLKPGQPVRLELDLERRAKTRANHSPPTLCTRR